MVLFVLAGFLVMHVQALQPTAGALQAGATTQEASLAAAARLDLSAWQARIPLGLLMTADAVKSKHILMLLHLMALAEPAGQSGGTLKPAAISKVDPIMGDTSAASDRACAALLQYELMRRDTCQHWVFLTNDDASAAGRGRAGSVSRSRAASCCEQGKQLAAGCSGPAFDSHKAVVAVSVGALLAWLGRSTQAAAVLQQVVDIAQGEQLLEQQVCSDCHQKHLTLLCAV
jgi:hypothetical protein